MNTDVPTTLRDFIRRRFGVPEDDSEFTDEVDLFNYGYVDSFGAVDLTAFVEKQFSITLSESDWVTHPLSSINQISSFVMKRQKGEI